MTRLTSLLRALAPTLAFASSLALVASVAHPARAADPAPVHAAVPVNARLLAAAPDLAPRALELALRAWTRARERGETASDVVTVIDYSRPSTEKRMWVLDLAQGRVLFHELVAHGRHTGENLARAFSNRPGSYQSSLGAFLTGTTYQGKHGLSLRLRGLEPGVNDRAETRAIVVHGAEYVSERIGRLMGRLGRSQGCPAVRPEVAPLVIDAIKGGTLLFAYYPDPAYERQSAYVAAAGS